MDIASLGISIQQTGVQEGSTNLNKLTDAATKADEATQKLADTSAGTSAALSGVGTSAKDTTDGLNAMGAATAQLAKSEEDATQRIKAMVQASLDQKKAIEAATDAARTASTSRTSSSASASSSSTKDTLGASFAAQAQELNSLSDALDHQAQSLSDVGELRSWVTELYDKGLISLQDSADYMERLDAQEKSLTKTINSHAAELQALLRQYDPASAALQKITADEKKLEQAFREGTITQQQYAKASAGIAVDRAKWQAEALAVNELSTGLKGLSLTSSFALREYTSMVNGLAAGNLGQVAREAGTLAVRTGALQLLMNPLAISVGAVAAATGIWAVATYQAEKENFELAKAITMTGNAAGVTAGQVGEMAKGISAITGTRSAATETLALLASTGAVAGNNLEQFALIAERLEKTVGQPVAETAKIFKELAKDPVAAAKKLQEQYGFLTSGVYDQIVALQKQGDAFGAADLAQKSFASEMSKRVDSLEGQLGTLQRFSNMVAADFKSMWDAVLNVGRQDTLEEQLKQLEETRKSQQTGIYGNTYDGSLDSKIASLKQAIATDNALAAAEAETVKETNAHIAATDLLNKLLKEQQSYVQALAKAGLGFDLSSIQRDLTATKAAYSNYDAVLEELHGAHLVSEQDYYAAKNQLIKQNADAEIGAINAQITRIRDADAQARALFAKRDNSNPEEAYAAAHALDQQQLADQNKIKELIDQIDAIKKKSATSSQLLGLQETQTNKKTADSYIEARTAAQSYLDVVTAQRNRELNGLGQGDKQRQFDSGLNSIDDRFTAEKKNLDDARLREQITKEEYDTRLQIAEEFRDKDLAGYNAYWNELGDKQSDFFTGASEAFANYQDSAANVAKSSADLFTNAFTGMEDALVSFVMTGKVNFKDFANSIVADLLRIQIRALAAKIFQSAAFSFASSGSTAMAGGTDVAASGTLFAANGAAFDRGNVVSMFADGGIVDQPTNFTYGGGQRGQAGEAGTEGILPLRRNAQGKLGVISSGGASVVNNNTYNIGPGNNVAELQSYMDQRDERLKADIINGMNRGRYGKMSNG